MLCRNLYIFCRCFILLIFLLSFKEIKADTNRDNVLKFKNRRNTSVLARAAKMNGFYKNDGSIDHSFFIRYQPLAASPTPIIIAFHGGGFIDGDKENFGLPLTINMTSKDGGDQILLTEKELDYTGFAYASANYLLLKAGMDPTIINSLTDCKDFVQYIKTNAAIFNIDSNKIILLGASAGAGASMWIGFQDPAIKGIIAISPQASLNVLDWRTAVFEPFSETKLFDENFIRSFENLAQMPLSNYSKLIYGNDDQKVIQEYSKTYNLNLLDLIDANDPELYLECTSTYEDIIHQTCHVYALKRKSELVGHQAKIQYTNIPRFYNDPETIIQFCKRKCD